jgi:hypothetical protein
MAFSSGVFTRLYSWATDKTNGVKITAARMDAEMNGMATGLSTCILKDGTQTTTAAVPFAAGLSVGTSFVSTAPNFSVTSGGSAHFGSIITVAVDAAASAMTVTGRAADNVGLINFNNNANTVNQAQIWTDDNGNSTGRFIFNVNSVNALTLTSSGVTVPGTFTSINGSLTMYGWSGSSDQSVIFMNQSGSKYLHQTGASFSFVGERVAILDSTPATSATTGALVVSGGIGVPGGLWVGTNGMRNDGAYDGTGNVYGNVFISRGTASTGTYYFGSNLTDYLTGGASGYVLSNDLTISQAGTGPTNGLKLLRRDNSNYSTIVTGSDNNLYLCLNGAPPYGAFNSSTGVYAALSDREKKKDIESIGPMWDTVKALNPVSYRMKTQDEDARKNLGFIAQEVRPLIPEAWFALMDETEGLEATAIIPVLTRALQEAMTRIEALEARP